MKKVSIIIRTKNEERWISSCLSSVFGQEFKDFEVIIVDNNSTDKTLEKARQFEVKVVNIDDFLPGRAINVGIRASSGEYIVCLSGHCIPVGNMWLSTLVKNISLPGVAGVYGRQEPLSYSSDLDKRDLLITFGLDRKVQRKDSFFHNANSIISRRIWEQIPFDEQTTNIEDRIWAQEVLNKGYRIIYEPEASVYHYHGIHQDRDQERCEKIVGILERIGFGNSHKTISALDSNIVSIIPVRGDVSYLGAHPLIEFTVQRSMSSKYIKHTVVAADNQKNLDIARNLGADIGILRPPELSTDYVEIQEVLKYSVEELEKRGIIPDIVLYLSITYPFRPKDLIDKVIEQLVNGGYDSILPSISERRSCWVEESKQLRRIDEGFMPSKFKNPVYIGISGLGTATYADILRRGDRLGKKVGVVEVDDILYSIDLGKPAGHKAAQLIIEEWWKQNK